MASATTNLKMMLLNSENLFLLSDSELKTEHLKLDPIQWARLSTSIYTNKSIEKTKALATIILNQSPDIVMLCEVGGLESLQNFNRLFLNEQYSPVLLEGNSNRHIDIGFLVKKNIGFYFDIISNKNRPINYLYPHERDSGKSSHKFSRDVAELHLFLNDRSKPFFVILLTHLKSQLDPDGVDANGFQRRQAELKTLLEIYQELEAKFENQVPIAICGDFNGNASQRATDLEFAPLYATTQLLDVCDLAGLPEDKAVTFFQVGRLAKTDGKQLDYAFLSPLLQSYLDKTSVQVIRYRDEMDTELAPPSTLEAKQALPSDHYPLIFSLKNLPLR